MVTTLIPEATLASRDPEAPIEPSEPEAKTAPREPEAEIAPKEPEAKTAPREPDATIAELATIAPDAMVTLAVAAKSEKPAPTFCQLEPFQTLK